MSRATSEAISIEVVAPRAGLPAWVSALPLWQWHEIPGTALSSVEPVPRPHGAPSSKIEAWCGATLKRRGSVYLVAMAGGHGDYAGNEVNALSLDADAPRWVQLRAPTPAEHVVTGAQFYLDRRPSASHTYYAQQFIEARNRLVNFGTQGMHTLSLPPTPADWPYKDTSHFVASFDMATSDWDAPEHIAPYPGTGDWTAALVAKNPATEDVYLDRLGGGLWRWSQAANTWTRVSSANVASNYAGAAIDPRRERMLVVGDYSGKVPPRLVNILDGKPLAVDWGGLGAQALTVGGYPGVVYDEANDCFLVLYNGADALIHILRVDAGSLHVDAPPIGSTAPRRRLNGVLNAVQYVAELGGIVIANEYRGNVKFLRTSV